MALFLDPFAPLFELSRQLPLNGTRLFVPAADVVVTDDDVTVAMDLPGFTADDVAIELREDVLTVKGERTSPYASDTNGDQRVWHHLERGFGTFERILRLPSGLDPDSIQATMADGVLTLRIPKPEARKPRRIAINSGTEMPSIESTATEHAAEQHELAGATA
jgi:HSP20 family protein